MGTDRGAFGPHEGLSCLSHDCSFMRPSQRDIPKLSPFPSHTGTTFPANAGWPWRRTMASCPGSCCQWTSPMCCHQVRRRAGEAVTAPPSTAWPWSRKVSETRADFFPRAPLSSAFPQLGLHLPLHSEHFLLWESSCAALSVFRGKNGEVTGVCSHMSRIWLAAKYVA